MKINAIRSIEALTFEKRDREKTKKESHILQNIASPVLNMHILLPAYQKRYERLVEGMSAAGQAMEKLVEDYARQYVIYKDEKLKTAEITRDHYYLAFLKTVIDFSRNIQNGTADYSKDVNNSAQFIGQYSTEWVFARETIPKTIEILEEEYKNVEQELKEKSTQNGFISSLMIEETFMKDIDDIAGLAMADIGTYDIKNVQGNDALFMSSLYNSSNPASNKYKNKINDLLHKLSLGATTEEFDNNAIAMPYYQELASRVIKNADRNYNMYVTYTDNDESAPEYFINSLLEQFNQIDDSEYKNIKKDKTKIVVFNKHSNLLVVADECAKYQKDPNTQYFIIFKDFQTAFFNSVSYNDGRPVINYTKVNNSISTKAKNIHFVLLNNQDDYYTLLEEPLVEKAIRDYQNLQLPIMDTTALKEQVILTKNNIKEQIGTEIDDDALIYIATLPLNSKGSGYDNVIRFVKNVASYYVDSEKITKDMVVSYWESTQKSDLLTTDSPYDIVFDTKKNLDSIIGTPMVKKQAQKIIYELKNFPKTKGYVIQKAGAQSGRLNCAKAIAGELQIPMICINAADFAMRDLDTVNQDPMKAIEVKMSKLLNTMRTQAQTNPNKMVMLYVSNFDHFASNPLYGLSSIYEQQAFQKLLKEMAKTYNDKSYNIVVMGASDYPEIINEDIVRPGLFMDTVTIYPPETVDNIKEIAQKHIEEKGYNLESGKTFDHFIKLMKSSEADYIDNIYLLDKAYVLAHKRGSDAISISDINEAYLSSIAGEVPENMLQDIHKEAVVRHEGGHALNLQFMYNLFKEKGDNLRIGDSIVNVVLDPRGWYGGCVYPMRSYDNMFEINMETIMSDLICDFGGNSSEEHFYDMQGSWGISQDRRIANAMAKQAVLYMGIGARTKHYMPDIDYTSGYPVLNSTDEEDYVKDVKTMLENAKIASDKIVKCYENFLIEFSAKYTPVYGTGECVVTGDEFERLLSDWENRQSPRKKQEIARLKKEILSIIEYTKKGIVYSGANKINPIYRIF